MTQAPARFNFKRYLASREWALVKRAVRERSGGLCERCHFRTADEVHHLTYERIGAEHLDDLLYLCKPCHRFESAVIDWDPAKCNCDPILAAAWADFVRDEDPAVYEAAFKHALDVADAYA